MQIKRSPILLNVAPQRQLKITFRFRDFFLELISWLLVLADFEYIMLKVKYHYRLTDRIVHRVALQLKKINLAPHCIT